jgi:cell division protein ZipA
MPELRWILLGAGLALIAGLYVWGVRSRRRSTAPDPARAAVFEQQPPESAGQARIEPQVRLDVPSPPVHEIVPSVDLGEDMQSVRAPAAGRREPTLGQRLTAPSPDRQSPSVEVRRQGAEAGSEATETAGEAEPDGDGAARAQRIVAIRVTAPTPSRFEGSALQEALLAEGFEFGRYQIFHRLDPVGRPVISLASLREPGTFDPATMAGAAYAGVALFSVLPGPMPAQHAFEELLVVGRSLAGRLGGNLQDDRGAPLSMQRIAQVREEMLAFDRDRAGRTGR